MKVVFSHALGVFVFDEHLHLLEKEDSTLNEGLRRAKSLEEDYASLKKKKTQDGRDPTPSEELKILETLATVANLKRLKEINMRLTGDALSVSVKPDLIIIQTIGLIEELTKVANTLVKRVREWYGFFYPEITEGIADNEGFINAVSTKDAEELKRELGILESVGSESSLRHDVELREFLRFLAGCYEKKASLEVYLEKLMKRECPNIVAVTGAPIGAKLIREAGGLERLAMTTSTTIQMLGAEKALFRHLKNKRIPPPKHGHIINHPLIAQASMKDKGKVARAIADKISLAARVDFFKGEFIGDRLRRELDEKCHG